MNVACGDPTSLEEGVAEPVTAGEGQAVERDGKKKPGGGSDAGDCDGGGTISEGSALDPLDPCATLLAEGEPLARAAWYDEPYGDVLITQEIALSWILPYAARVPLADRSAHTLEVERCDSPAHTKTSCSTTALTMPSAECGDASIRFGLDPTQYRRGTNHYDFTLRLRHGCVVDSVDTFSMTLRYDPTP